MEGSPFSADVVRSALDALEEQVAILDCNGVITQVNEAWRQWALAGASLAAAVEGGRYQELLGVAAAAGDHDAAELKAGFERVLAGNEVLFEREYMRQRGDGVRWFNGRVTRLRTSAGDVVVAHYEITARKRAEQERESHRVELGRAVRAATLGQLGGALAHELNQPLTAILANAQAAHAALGAALFEEQSQILCDIVEDARRAGQVIHRLRSLLQKHAAKLEVVDINHITEDVLVLSRSALLLRKVRLMPSLWGGPLLVRGDAIELQHLLLNLIVNACEAMASTEPGKRVLRVVTLPAEPDQVRVAISDSGPGIEPLSRDRIFEPFYTTKKHGLGLGLSICRSIAAVHHGRLVVADSAAGGAEVTLEIPAAHPPARATAPAGMVPDGCAGPGPGVPPGRPAGTMRHPWNGA